MMPDRRPTKRRLFQFSLRTALVLLTAACIGLGLETESVRQQRQLVRIVESFGGEAIYDYQYDANDDPFADTEDSPPGPKLLRAVLGDDYFADLVSVRIEGVADLDVARIAAQTTLRHLSITGGIGDEALESIAKLSRLERLELYGGRFSGAGLDRLANLPRLRRLTIGNMALTDEAARSIGRLTGLEQLSLENTRLASRHAQHLKNLRHLISLDLSGTLVGDEGLAALYELKELKSVDLDGTMATPKGIEKLQKELPGASITLQRFRHGRF
jgi:hypothetical protein